MDKTIKRLLTQLETEVSNSVPFRHYQSLSKCLFASAQLIEAMKVEMKKHHRLRHEADIFLNTIYEHFEDGSVVMYTDVKEQAEWIGKYISNRATLEEMPKPKRKK